MPAAEWEELIGNERQQAELEEQARLQAERDEKLSQILISSGFSFDGFRIVKYSGYISGDDAVEIPRGGLFAGHSHGEKLTNALVSIRRQALRELKEAAYNLGCNAVIGVDFDYITLEPETANIVGGTTYEPYVICVTANGNAVVIEKE
ncbi:MAG: heavy metal-binding domain-containing protein [Oscillospiraceae bacterium]|nr:heavy metal-binding domain-containing protein [Oscillospiraceae bacterium]